MIVFMAKNPLIHFEGALFHITTRGNNRQPIFFEDRNFQKYFANLAKTKEKLPFKLYSFVLMPNHVHLLIEVNKHPINKIMQVIQTAYTMYFNRKYNRTGHLFQGRYKSFLVDKDSYLLQLISYINLNPVRARIVKDPTEYKWSSHNAFLDSNHEFNPILERKEVLANFSLHFDKQVEAYNEFILSEIGNKWEDIFPKPAWEQIIGREKFIQKMERKIRKILKSRAS